MIGEPLRGGLPEPGLCALAGLEQVQARRRGLVPRSPLEHLIGLSWTQVGPGAVTVRVPASVWFQMASGTLDFLVAAATALWAAVLSGASPASEVRVVGLSVTQFRPWTLDSEALVVRARTVAGSDKFTFAEAAVEDDRGHSVAHVAGTAVVELLDPPPPTPGPRRQVETPRYVNPDPYLRPLPAELSPMPREQRLGLRGIDVFRALEVGKLPPFPSLALLGLRLESVKPGHAVWRMSADEWFCLQNRTVSPGVLASAGHGALLSALVTMGERGEHIAMVGETLNFLGPVAADGAEVMVEATVTESHGELMAASLVVTCGRVTALGHATAMFIPMHRPTRPPPRTVLATVVFTDIVSSTARAASLGDERWADLHAAHDDVIRRMLGKHNGREIKSTGDGFLLVFSTPADAVAFARSARHDIARLDLEIRVGIHTGQCDEAEGDISGIAVHLASRVLAAADPGEVLVTSTVRDLLLGADVTLEDRGAHELKGIDGTWTLFALGKDR